MRLHEIQTRNCVKHLEVLEPRSGRRISVSFVPYFLPVCFPFRSPFHEATSYPRISGMNLLSRFLFAISVSLS